MTQPWLGWLVRDYQKEVLDVVEKFGLRMEEVDHEDEPGCIAIYVDPPEGYENASIMTPEEYGAPRDERGCLGEEKHLRVLDQITGSCRQEQQFGQHIWFEARRGYPSAYMGKPRPMRVGEVYTIWDYCHMLARHNHFPREGIIIPDEEIGIVFEEVREQHFPNCKPTDRKCSFMCSVGMIFPDWLK